jgi:phospholipase C
MAQVTLFSDRQFAGSSVPLDEGDTRFSSDFNDTASSIRVAPGYCAMLYEHANEFSGYGAWVDLLEDCPDLAVYGFDKKTSYVHVFRAERDGFVWARGAMRDGQFIPGHWERKRASGVSPNSAVAVVAPPLPPRTTPLPAGDGVVIRDHRGEPQQHVPAGIDAGGLRFATFTMDNFGISNTRSLHEDTDFVYLSATVGANPPVFVQKSMGDVNNGTHSVGLSVEVDIPDDDTIVVFSYLVINNGHGGNDAKAKAAQSALSTIAKEIIAHKAITATSIAVGSILVPFFASAVAVVAGVMGLVEGGLVLFADCDGAVASGTLPFKCSDLIKRTSSGQKISDNTHHPGTDSPTGCGSNSSYSTSCTIATAPSIETVLDLRGQWVGGGVPGPFVSRTGNSISIDMSALKRPTATGTVVNSSEISVHFPDDKTYSGALQKPGAIVWSNNSSWTKFNTSVIKHLFVLMMENRSFDHLLGFQGITGKDTRTGAATKAEDLTGPGGAAIAEPYNDFANLRYTVTPTAGDVIFDKDDVQHQFLDVLTQLCGQAEGQAVSANGGLKGGAYPQVAEATKTGFAADYATKSDSGKENPGEPMRGFAKGALPVLTALAKEFVLCDHWFSSIPGPTEPNRMFVHAATSGVWDDSPSNSDYEEIFGGKSAGDTDDGISFENGTIFDALRRAKVPFRIYAGDGFPQVGLLSGISLYSDVDDFENFAADINEPTYDAAYTFIEPRYDTISQQLGLPFVNNSQHPANSVALGEGLIKTVYEAIRNSPRWNQSMLIITWDEHGGFFDHVTPPRAARIPTKSSPNGIEGKYHGFMFDQYGVRVPAVVISPWCPQNMIEHRQLEHSFIPATIEQLFGLRPLTNRDTGVVGLQTLATLSAPRNVTTPIPDAHAASEPSGPVPGGPITSSVASVSSAVGSISEKALAATSVGPGPAASSPPARTESSTLDLNDPWLASALAVAAKAHIEAAPADAANIKARVAGLKTIGDLAQYYKDMTPIVSNARAVAAPQKVAARKHPVSLTGAVLTEHQVVTAVATEKLV